MLCKAYEAEVYLAFAQINNMNAILIIDLFEPPNKMHIGTQHLIN